MLLSMNIIYERSPDANRGIDGFAIVRSYCQSKTKLSAVRSEITLFLLGLELSGEKVRVGNKELEVGFLTF